MMNYDIYLDKYTSFKAIFIINLFKLIIKIIPFILKYHYLMVKIENLRLDLIICFMPNIPFFNIQVLSF